MAGGEGTRLRPLTCDCPKPMIRLMNRPLMAYALDLMKRHGIVNIAVTLGYRPEAIADYFGDGEAQGVSLRYYIEQTPLGTAGGVRQARDFLNETFVVLSGDGVTDFDISRALAFHRERRALATLVLKHADNPLEYGVVDVDAQGRVRSFHEKPDWSEVVSDTVNTGIYILEPEVLDRVPEGKACDFGHELFPRMAAEGLPVYGYITSDYWCDVGDVRAYLAVHADAMEGRIRLDGLTDFAGRAVQMPGARVDRAAVVEGPCLIESGARICAGARIGPYCVVGEGCLVGEQASLKRSVLWPGARLAPGAQARGCVLAGGASLGEGAQAYEECVLGAGAETGARSVLMPGVKLWPCKRAAEGERLDANRVWGHGREPGFSAGALAVEGPAEVTRAAQAWVAAMKPREVVMGHTADPAAEADWHAAAAGCMAQGVQVISVGQCTLPVLRHAQRRMQADAALLVDSGFVVPLNGLGARLTRSEQRSVALLNARQDYPRPIPEAVAPMMSDEAAVSAYIADVAARMTADPARLRPVSLRCDHPWALDVAQRVFSRAGVPEAGEPEPPALDIHLDTAGERCTLSDEYGPLTDAQTQMMTAWIALEHGDRSMLLPDNATRGIDALLRRYDARAEYVSGESSRWMNLLARRQPLQFELHFDGLIWAVEALSLLAEKEMSLSDWRRDMPEVYRSSRSLPLPQRQNGRVLHAFAQARPEAKLGGGVRLERPEGWAWVGAEEGLPHLKIIAEAASSETAAELCDFCEGELRRICEAEAQQKR